MKRITKIEPLKASSVERKLRVAAYCRVSTGAEDQLLSLETQKSHYEGYITANPGWTFAGLYYDEGISGTNKEKRPALMKMLADCEDGKIDRILTKSLSRVARNTADCLELVRKLLDLGVTIYFEKEDLDTGTMESELLLSIMSSLAESESASISENNRWSIRHRFETGTFKIGSAPYGYNVHGGEFTINEEEAKWVRWIFGQAVNGMTCTKIAKQLNEMKVLTKRNGSWTDGTVRKILTNEKYIGDCLFQKTYSDFRFKRHVNRGERDQFYVKDHHEPIVSEEEFETVRALLEHRAKERNVEKNDLRYRNRYPFSGMIICGKCGEKLKRHMTLTGSNRYAVWICKKHLSDNNACTMKAVRESDLEYAFTTMMNKLIFARGIMLEPLRNSLREKRHKESLQRIDEIGQLLEKNMERRRTLTTIMTGGFVDPTFFARESSIIDAEEERLTTEKEQMIKEIKGDIRQLEELDILIRYTANAQMATDFQGDLVHMFLDHACLCSKHVIIFHLKCGLSLTERM